MAYLVLKGLHIVAVVSWFAGLLYLPRLFVYHADSKSNSVVAQLRIMEARLYRLIMNPALAAVYILGFGLMAMNPGLLNYGWLQVKLLLVVMLTIYHLSLGRWLRQMQSAPPSKTAKFFRVYNELPTIALIVIVLLAITKAF